MKLNEGIEWALHCVSILAALPPGATLPTKTLAQYHELSETYLAKHLQSLTSAAIIESVPGPKGGYRLLRSPEAISLLDVVEAIDGKTPIFRCTEIRQNGPMAQAPEAYRIPCGISVAMARAEKAWRNELRAQTIADMMQAYAKNVSAEHQQRCAEWFTTRMRTPTSIPNG